VPLPRPTATERAWLWRATLDGSDVLAELELGALATKFKFTAGQIQDAAVTAANLARWREPDSGRFLLPDLYEACRLHSNQTLATLARKLTPKYHWADRDQSEPFTDEVQDGRVSTRIESQESTPAALAVRRQKRKSRYE
jgi:hypothetical protein